MGYNVVMLRFVNEAAKTDTLKNALREYLFNAQEAFFGKPVSEGDLKDTKGSNERGHEIMFNVAFTDDARANRNSIVKDLLKKFDFHGRKFTVADNDDFVIKSDKPLHITGNDHVKIIDAKTKELVLIIKYSRAKGLDTVYKEGLKVLFTNYLINLHFRESNNDIRGQIVHYIKNDDDMHDFLEWVEKPNNASLKKTLIDKEYTKLYNWIETLAFHANPARKPNTNDLKYYLEKYNLSCKVMFSLAASERSYLTRNQSAKGELGQYYNITRDYAANKNGVNPSKQHPADVIMVGSVIDYAPMSIYWQDGKMTETKGNDAIVCTGISLKESEARWGKATEALLNFNGHYISSSNGKSEKMTLRELRNNYLEKSFADEEDNPMVNNYLDVLSNVCAKFKFYHLVQSGDGLKEESNESAVDLSKIKNIEKLKLMKIEKKDGKNQKSLNSLSMKQMYNIFFTALFASLSEVDIAYLFNESLQLSSKSYYMVKDNLDSERVLGRFTVTPNMIGARDIEYTGAGDKKVTRVFIPLNISENDAIRNSLPPMHKGHVEADIRQTNTEKEADKGLNSTIEFK